MYIGIWSWVGPNRTSTSSEKGKNDTMPFTDGCDLNPQLTETNINVIRNNITDQCSLEINNFSRIDEGTYKCQSVKLKDHVFNVFIKSKYQCFIICMNRKNNSCTNKN